MKTFWGMEVQLHAFLTSVIHRASRPGCFILEGKKKIPSPAGSRNTGRPARSLVTIIAELSLHPATQIYHSLHGNCGVENNNFYIYELGSNQDEASSYNNGIEVSQRNRKILKDLSGILSIAPQGPIKQNCFLLSVKVCMFQKTLN
jgi:hypothetical protein